MPTLNLDFKDAQPAGPVGRRCLFVPDRRAKPVDDMVIGGSTVFLELESDWTGVIDLVGGSYQVKLPQTDPFTVLVPADGGPYNLGDLITEGGAEMTFDVRKYAYQEFETVQALREVDMNFRPASARIEDKQIIMRWDKASTAVDNGHSVIKPETIQSNDPGRYLQVI